MQNKARSTTGPGRKFLVFHARCDEEYGIEILKVQEIRGYEAVTRIANAPAYIKGVINLRGIIVPIVDLRIKFNLGSVEYNEQTVVIILNLDRRVVGIVVDGVSDVLMLNAGQIRPAPEFGATLSTEYLTGPGDGRRTHADPGRHREDDVEQRNGADRDARSGSNGRGSARPIKRDLAAAVQPEPAIMEVSQCLQNWSIRTDAYRAIGRDPRRRLAAAVGALGLYPAQSDERRSLDEIARARRSAGDPRAFDDTSVERSCCARACARSTAPTYADSEADGKADDARRRSIAHRVPVREVANEKPGRPYQSFADMLGLEQALLDELSAIALLERLRGVRCMTAIEPEFSALRARATWRAYHEVSPTYEDQPHVHRVRPDGGGQRRDQGALQISARNKMRQAETAVAGSR